MGKNYLLTDAGTRILYSDGASLSSIPGRRTRFFSSTKTHRPSVRSTPVSYSIDATDSCLGVRWPGRDHLHLMPRLRMNGAIPLLPLYAIEPRTKATLLLLYCPLGNHPYHCQSKGQASSFSGCSNYQICRALWLSKVSYLLAHSFTSFSQHCDHPFISFLIVPLFTKYGCCRSHLCTTVS